MLAKNVKREELKNTISSLDIKTVVNLLNHVSVVVDSSAMNYRHMKYDTSAYYNWLYHLLSGFYKTETETVGMQRGITKQQFMFNFQRLFLRRKNFLKHCKRINIRWQKRQITKDKIAHETSLHCCGNMMGTSNMMHEWHSLLKSNHANQAQTTTQIQTAATKAPLNTQQNTRTTTSLKSENPRAILLTIQDQDQDQAVQKYQNSYELVLKKSSTTNDCVDHTLPISIPIPLSASNSTTKIIIIQTCPKANKATKIQTISAPFLLRSEPTTYQVKENLPIKNITVKNRNTTTSSNGSILINTPTQAQIQTQTQISQESKVNTLLLTKTGPPTENYLNILSKTNCTELPTLASMAGIQLTDSDALLQDMSGAMPPTATVEENNVPVFINEFLQQSTPITTTTDSATNKDEEYDFLNNTSSATSSSNNNINKNNNCINTLADFDFEFDVDLLCETNNHTGAITPSATSAQQQQGTAAMFATNNIDNILCYDTNDNKNTDMDVGIANSFQFYENFESCFNNNSNSMDSFLLKMDADLDVVDTENAIDINEIASQDTQLSQYLCNSQVNPMLGGSDVVRLDNNQRIVTDAEPLLPIDDEDIKEFCEKIPTNSQTFAELFDMPAIIAAEECNTNNSNDISTNSQNSTNNNNISITFKDVSQRKINLKRMKLEIPQSFGTFDLNTPTIVENILDMKEENECPLTMMIPLKNEADLQIENNNSNLTSDSDFQTYIDEETGAGMEYSNSTAEVVEYSFTHFTDNSMCSASTYNTRPVYTPTTSTIITSPNSPAASIASTSYRDFASPAPSAVRVKRRGRPAKACSDRIDPRTLARLPQSERKRLEERFKNNEASRVSRRKNKAREEAEIAEEQALMQRNLELNDAYNQLNIMRKKLERRLRRLHIAQQRAA